LNIAVSDPNVCQVLGLTDTSVIILSMAFGQAEVVLNAYKYDWVAFKYINVDVPTHAYKIAYEQEDGYFSDICVINQDGSGFINVTNTPDLTEEMPSLNFSGEYVGYMKQEGGYFDVVVTDLSNNIVYQMNDPGAYQSIEFLLDRDMFGCLRANYTNADFWFLNGNESSFVGFPDYGSYPYMHQVKVNSIADGGSSGVCIRSIYGPNVYQNNYHVLFYSWHNYATDILHTSETISYPCMAPDSSFIVYTRGYGNESEIVRYHYDQELEQKIFVDLTDNDFADEHPRIDPMSERIVFSSNRNGNYDLFIMDEDGGNVVQITSSPEDDIRPDWK